MLDFTLPEVGEGITSGTVIGVLVKVGDTITANQDLLEVETDKASLPVPAPCDGVVRAILVNEGDEVDIGAVVMRIEESGSGAASAPAPAEEKKPEAKKAPAPAPAAPAPAPTSAPQPAAAAAQTATVSARTPLPNHAIPAQGDVAASPAVRRLARELGINLSQVPGTGPGGRISKDDVKAFTKQIVLSGGGAVKQTKPLPDFTKFGAVKREKMSKIRQVTKDHMAHCWETIPHVTQFDKADVTDLDKYRKEVSTPERKITVTSFLIKVLADALKEFPQFNCSIDTDSNEIIFKQYVNIGVAVDTPNGLLVPVLRDVDQKGIVAITDDLTGVAQKARDRKVLPNDLQGGSITVTNLGGIGGHAFTPIVNWPEVSILGVSRGGFEPTWNGDKFEPRLKLPLCLSYDHRIIDGADAARFLRFICTALEQKIEVT